MAPVAASESAADYFARVLAEAANIEHVLATPQPSPAPLSSSLSAPASSTTAIPLPLALPVSNGNGDSVSHPRSVIAIREEDASPAPTDDASSAVSVDERLGKHLRVAGEERFAHRVMAHK